MTLGERITAYRTGAGLSQDQLAERLEVSRQSVSKWETDASVPELSKLLRLSEVFGVTLDALVKGEEAPENAPSGGSATNGGHAVNDGQWEGDGHTANEESGANRAPVANDIPNGRGGETEAASPHSASASMEETLRRHRQKLAGIVILALSAVALILAPWLLLLAWPVTAVGLLLLLGRRVSALSVCWTLWLGMVVVCYLCTSAALEVIVQPYWYGLGLTAQMIVAWAQWLMLAALVAATVRWFQKNGLTLRTHVVLCGAWLVWLGVALGGILTLRFNPFRLLPMVWWLIQRPPEQVGASALSPWSWMIPLTQLLALAVLVVRTARTAKRQADSAN